MVALILGLSLAAQSPAQIQNSYDDPDEAMAALAKEPAFTQQELDTYIKYLPELLVASENEDTAAVQAIAEKAGWTEIRLAYISLKIGNGYGIVKSPEYAEFAKELFPPELLPTANENELIAKNMPALDKVFGEYEAK